VLAEVLAETLAKASGSPMAVVHRDVARRDAWGPRPEVPRTVPPPLNGMGDGGDVLPGAQDPAQNSVQNTDLDREKDEPVGPPSVSAVERVGLAGPPISPVSPPRGAR
jgi:hypothetical protein